jgi:hypothetical protein
MGILFRLYINALLRGNPFVVLITVIGGVAVSVGPFYEGLASRDPVAIGFAGFIFVGILIVLTVAVIDRRLNAPKTKKGSSSRPSRR